MTVAAAVALCAALGACNAKPGGAGGDTARARTAASDTATRLGAPSGGTDSVSATGDTLVPVTISVSMGGQAYQARSRAQCSHTDQASIYNVRAAMWSVYYLPSGSGSDPRFLNLTVWHPLAGGADQLSFGVTAGSKSHEISTLTGRKAVGSGTVKLESRGAGARFTVDGRDAEGTPVRATVECQRLTKPVVMGGGAGPG